MPPAADRISDNAVMGIYTVVSDDNRLTAPSDKTPNSIERNAARKGFFFFAA